MFVPLCEFLIELIDFRAGHEAGRIPLLQKSIRTVPCRDRACQVPGLIVCGFRTQGGLNKFFVEGVGSGELLKIPAKGAETDK